MGFFSIAKAVVAPIAKIGGQYLENRAKISQAGADYQIAVLTAKSGLAVKEQEIKLIDAKGQIGLDMQAVKDMSKSWFDEGLVLGYLYLLYLAVTDPAYAKIVIEALDMLPLWYLYGVGLIGVRFLGFRRLLNKFLDARNLFAGKKV